MNCVQNPFHLNAAKLAAATLFLAAAALHATEFYVTPTGAGSLDASSLENAAAAASASSIFNDKMKAGDRLLIGEGTYQDLNLTLNNGGTAENPKIIEGVKSPVLTSSWSVEKPDKGPTAITLGNGLSGVTFKNLTIKNYCFSIRAGVSKEAPRTHLIFDGIEMEQMRHGFYLSDCDDLLISNCKMKRYSKHGYRFDQGCNKVVVRNCSADCSEGDAVWETKTELFPFGFTINDGGTPNTGFLFEDCLAKNNLKSNQGSLKYTNGDGFVVEGNTTDVTFLRCHSFRNQDGGFDLKVKDVKLTDCVATGQRRDYRIWSTGTLENCFGGWSQTGLWSKGGPITATHCTFHGHRGSGVELEGKAPGPLTLIKCVISTDGKPAKYAATIGKIDLQDTAVARPGDAGDDPKFVKADPKWDGQGSWMDNAQYPGKGYSSTRLSKAH